MKATAVVLLAISAALMTRPLGAQVMNVKSAAASTSVPISRTRAAHVFNEPKITLPDAPATGFGVIVKFTQMVSL